MGCNLCAWLALLSRPVGGHKKTFEELLEEQLRLEEQRLKSVRQQEVRQLMDIFSNMGFEMSTK